MDKKELQHLLEELIAGMWYGSESDYPFELLDWGNKPALELNGFIEQLPLPLENVPVDVFFNRYIDILQTGKDETSMLMTARYKKLEQFISTSFSNITVWRSGKIQVAIYIVMATAGNDVFALKTISIET